MVNLERTDSAHGLSMPSHKFCLGMRSSPKGQDCEPGSRGADAEKAATIQGRIHRVTSMRSVDGRFVRNLVLGRGGRSLSACGEHLGPRHVVEGHDPATLFGAEAFGVGPA